MFCTTQKTTNWSTLFCTDRGKRSEVDWKKISDRTALYDVLGFKHCIQSCWSSVLLMWVVLKFDSRPWHLILLGIFSGKSQHSKLELYLDVGSWHFVTFNATLNVLRRTLFQGSVKDSVSAGSSHNGESLYPEKPLCSSHASIPLTPPHSPAVVRNWRGSGREGHLTGKLIAVITNKL